MTVTPCTDIFSPSRIVSPIIALLVAEKTNLLLMYLSSCGMRVIFSFYQQSLTGIVVHLGRMAHFFYVYILSLSLINSMMYKVLVISQYFCDSTFLEPARRCLKVIFCFVGHVVKLFTRHQCPVARRPVLQERSRPILEEIRT